MTDPFLGDKVGGQVNEEMTWNGGPNDGAGWLAGGLARRGFRGTIPEKLRLLPNELPTKLLVHLLELLGEALLHLEIFAEKLGRVGLTHQRRLRDQAAVGGDLVVLAL